MVIDAQGNYGAATHGFTFQFCRALAGDFACRWRCFEVVEEEHTQLRFFCRQLYGWHRCEAF